MRSGLPGRWRRGDVITEGPNNTLERTGLILPILARVTTPTAQRDGIDYLMTWNCTHIANAEMGSHIMRTCHLLGYVAPILCTPEELLGD